MGCNSTKSARSHSTPVLIASNSRDFLEKPKKKASFSPQIPLTPLKIHRKSLKNHKNSLILQNSEDFALKSPQSPGKNASKTTLFPWRRKSISQLLCQKSSSIEKKGVLAKELEQLLKTYSQTTRNFRKISQNSEISNKKPSFFYSPLVKDAKKREILEEYGLSERKAQKDSVFRTKIKSLFGNFARNSARKPEKPEKIGKISKKSAENAENRLGWQELNVPLGLNRQQFQRVFKEERDFLQTFATKPKKFEGSLTRLLTKTSNIACAKEKLNEKQRKVENSAEFSQTSARKTQISKKIEASSPKNVQKYSANHKESVTITVYSENAEKIQKKLFEKMSLEKILTQGNLKLADGQLKYVKNGRLYVFNLNENVVLHKDKIIQFVREDHGKKEKEFTHDDLFNFIVKNNISPTEYFCNEFKRKKFPYKPKK